MTTLAALGLTTPTMLLGASLVVLPLIAHLLNRKARQRVVFPNVAMLTNVSASQSSLLKLRRWLLLLLRCIAVALIAFAFARPLWWSSDAGANARPDEALGASAVLVIDCSASVDQLHGSTTARQALQGQAERLLNESWLRRANVVFAGGSPRPVFEQMTANKPALIQAIREEPVVHERADLAGALTQAARLLHESGSRDVVVLTDRQWTNWEGVSDIDWPRGTTLGIVPPTGEAAAGNTALLAPGVRPGSPGVGTPVELAVELARFGGEAQRVAVELDVDGRVVDTQWARVEPHGRQRLSFTHRFNTVGQHRVRFKLTGQDALATDNTAYLVVRCVERLPVIVVGDANPDQPGSDGYYITRALAPFGDERDRYRVTHLPSHAATPAALAGASLVVVGQTLQLTPTLGQNLAEYARAGGSLLVFAGQHPLRDALVLPWSLGDRHTGQRIGEIEDAAEMHGLGEATQDALTQLPLGQTWQAGVLNDAARPLARYANGGVALAAQPLGDGRVVAATFSPAAESGDLGKYGVFVALTQHLAEQLTAHRGERAVRLPGQTLTIIADAAIDPDGPPPAVVGPDDTTITAIAFGQSGETRTAIVGASDTRRVGFYSLCQGPATLGWAAVNLDPLESDLRPMDVGVIVTQLERSGSGLAIHAGRDSTEALAAQQGRPIWGWALLVALGVMGLEMALLGWWRR